MKTKKFKNLLVVLSVGLGLGMISGVAHTGGFTNEVRRVEAATQTVTMSYSSDSTSSMAETGNAKRVGLSATDWKVDASKGSNYPGLNKDKYIALYAQAGCNFTVTSLKSNVVISSITLTYTTNGYNGAKVTVGEATISDTNSSNTVDKFAINSNSFTVASSKKLGQTRIKSLVISYEEQAAINSVSLNKTSTSIELGKTETLTATVDPEGSELVWESSNSSVASVENGVVTASDVGTTTIKVSAKDDPTKFAICEVTVTKAQVLVQDAFASVETQAGLEFGYTKTVSGSETEVALGDTTWTEDTNNNIASGGKDNETPDSLKNAIFRDYASYVTSISRANNSAARFPGIASGNLEFFSAKASGNTNHTQMDFEFTQNVSAIKVTYTTTNKITMIIGSESTVIDGGVKVNVNSSSFTLKNCNPGDGKDASNNRVTIDSLTLYFGEQSVSYSNFTDMKMKFRYEFNTSNYTGTVSEQGIIVSTDGGFSFENGMFTSTNIQEYMDICPVTKKAIKTSEVTTSDFIVSVAVPVANYNTKLYASAYIVVDGNYYFAKPINSGKGYSVADIAEKYLALTGDQELSAGDKELITALKNECAVA